MPALQCLTDESLRAYQSGTADPELIEAASSHLSSCSSCLIRLQAVEVGDDPLLCALRRQQVQPPRPLDPLVAAAMGQIVAPAVELGAGAILHEYRLLEKLGAGGMGTVYRAVHVRLDKEVALKVIHPLRVRDPHVRERFGREMRAIGKLRHPHIVLATDAGEAGGTLYLVMELEEGTDLSQWVRENGRLPVAEACEYVRQAALGLQAAHDAGLVHRDLKPSNIFRTAGGQIKLLDLGLALLDVDTRPPADPAEHTATETHVDVGSQTTVHTFGPMGTAEYMAPEQWSDAHRVDSRADLYSLGCTLYFLLTGQPPFALPRPTTRDDICEAHHSAAPRGLREIRDDIPPRLAALVNRLLAKQPQDRFASAADVARELAAFAQPKTRRALWISVAGVAAIGALVAAVMANRPPARTVIAGVADPTSPPSGEVHAPASAAPAEAPPTSAPEFAGPPSTGTLPMKADVAQKLQRHWAIHLQQPPSCSNSLGMELVLIPPGEFRDIDNVELVIGRPFYLGATEVTTHQFRQFVQQAGHVSEVESGGLGGLVINADQTGKNMRLPSYTWSAPGVELESQECPVVQVTWSDAVAFCDWLSKQEKATYRLQTAAEWVWACRAGYRGANYPGDRAPLTPREWLQANSDNRPRAVRTQDANPWGLFDMNGNVSEWCLDDYDRSRRIRVVDKPVAGTGPTRIIAGNNYAAIFAHFRVITERLPKSLAASTIGFRVVREIAP